MPAWLISAVLSAFVAFGMVMYRFGRKAAENETLKAGARENEKVDQAVCGNANLNRDELLAKLRDRKDK